MIELDVHNDLAGVDAGECVAAVEDLGLDSADSVTSTYLMLISMHRYTKVNIWALGATRSSPPRMIKTRSRVDREAIRRTTINSTTLKQRLRYGP